MQRILAVDRRTLRTAERRALRNELSALQQEAAAYERDGTVIHISGAGLLIIIILLIVLL